MCIPGVVFPSAPERSFNATLTEVYVCSQCHKSYRFPRAVVISRYDITWVPEPWGRLTKHGWCWLAG
jgi:hypothetical protein